MSRRSKSMTKDHEAIDLYRLETLKRIVAKSDEPDAVKHDLETWLDSCAIGCRPARRGGGPSMKDWVIRKIAEAGPKGADLKELKEGFAAEFRKDRLRSLNQYLSKSQELATKTNQGRYLLTDKGQEAWEEL